MRLPRRWRTAALAGIVLAATAATTAVAPAPAAAPARAATSAAPGHAYAPVRALTLLEPSPADTAREELAQLNVAAPHPMTGYSREKFPHWITQYGTCNTREVVLARDGQDVKQDEQCRAISGTWTSAYDGKVITASPELDVDHVDPLANAWRSGADEWTTDRRRAFANDLTHPQLIAVSAASNRSKGDQSPDQWRPPLRPTDAPMPAPGPTEIHLPAEHHRPREEHPDRDARHLPQGLMPHRDDAPARLETQVTTGPGAAMTVEVGVITGDLTLATAALGDGRAEITIQYTGAEEWYILDGSPALIPADGLAGLHQAAIHAVQTGGAARAPG